MPAEPEKRGNYDFMNNYFPFSIDFFIIYVMLILPNQIRCELKHIYCL